MKESLLNKKIILYPGVFICDLLILSLAFPQRGAIFGIRYYMLIFAAIFLEMIFVRKILTRIPLFYLIYFLVEVLCAIIHFSTREPLYMIIPLINIIGTYYVVVTAITNETTFNKVINFILVMFSVYAVFGIIEAFMHFNVFDALTGTTVEYEFANEMRFGLARARGALDISINNGMMLGLVLCLAAYKLINATGLQKKYYTIPYFLILINAFLTLSRSVWLGILFSQLIIFLGLSTYKKLSVLAKIAVGGFAIVLLLLIAFPKIADSLFSILADMSASVLNVLGFEQSSTLAGEGNRIDLWGWVWDKVKDDCAVGFGFSKPFAYRVSSKFTKESIEVMWLYRLYRTGFIGLGGFIVLQVGSIIYLLKNRKRTLKMKKLTLPENCLIKREKIDFNYIVFAASIVYFFELFGCSAFEDLRFFLILLSLAFAYNRINNNALKSIK